MVVLCPWLLVTVRVDRRVELVSSMSLCSFMFVTWCMYRSGIVYSIRWGKVLPYRLAVIEYTICSTLPLFGGKSFMTS